MRGKEKRKKKKPKLPQSWVSSSQASCEEGAGAVLRVTRHSWSLLWRGTSRSYKTVPAEAAHLPCIHTSQRTAAPWQGLFIVSADDWVHQTLTLECNWGWCGVGKSQWLACCQSHEPDFLWAPACLCPRQCQWAVEGHTDSRSRQAYFSALGFFFVF